MVSQGLARAFLGLDWASLGLAQASWVGGMYGWTNGQTDGQNTGLCPLSEPLPKKKVIFTIEFLGK